MSLWDRFRLEGRRAVIAGGSRGLGLSMARAVAEAGADLVLIGRDAASLEGARSELCRPGRTVDAVAGDLSIPLECERICNDLLDRYGPISILVNNVGGRRISKPTEQLTLDEWQKTLDLNLTSTFLCCKHIGGHMVERRQGSIINLASIAGLVATRAIQGRSYEAAKAGVIALTRSLAVDWAPHNVRVNAIVPGGFWTEPNRRWATEKPDWQPIFESMIPMGRLGDPEEIGPLAVFLASDAASYVTGAAIVIDGGYTAW